VLDIDPAQPLTVTATPVEAPGRAGRRLTVAGELDLQTAPALAATLAEQLADGHDVELELSGVGFIDSSGIRVLVQARTAALAAGRTLTLCAPLPSQMHRVFEVAGLLERFEFLPEPAGG
jgi:anti-sigma B factor antagonist